jgi:hypothetical protein
MEWLVPIVVALIGGPLVIVIQNLRKENSADHAVVRGLLESVVTQIDKVDDKLDNHISWHMAKTRRKKIDEKAD